MPGIGLTSGALALQVTQVPVWLLKTTRNFLRSFQWARDAADRLVSSVGSSTHLTLAFCVP